MIILDTKDMPSPAIVIMLIAAMAILVDRGGWWLVAGLGVLAFWIVTSAVTQIVGALHMHIAEVGESLEDVFGDMEPQEDGDEE